MAPKTATVRFDVTIKTSRHGGDGDIPALLDMLRYEGGRVVDWTRTGPDASDYRVTIDVTPAFQHQPDRWRSFGIVPVGETVAR